MDGARKATSKVTQIGQKVAAAAEPVVGKAAEFASTAAAAAGPRATHAKGKAIEIVERAGEVGAKGVNVVAETLDKATGGKYAGRISSVTSKVEDRLDPDK